MRRTVVLIVVAGVLIGACTDSPPQEAAGETITPLNTYRYTMTFEDAGESDETTIEVVGAVDDDKTIAELRWLGAVDEPDSFVVQSAAGFAVKVPRWELLPSDTEEVDASLIDLDAWYGYDPWAYERTEGRIGDLFFLSGTLTSDSLWNMLGVDPDRSVTVDGVVEQAVLRNADLEPLWGMNTFLDMGGRARRLEVVSVSDDGGQLLDISVRYIRPARGTLRIEITEQGMPVDIFVPEETIALPVDNPDVFEPENRPTTEPPGVVVTFPPPDD